MPYLLFLKKQPNLKLSSAANYRWSFSERKLLIQCISFPHHAELPYPFTKQTTVDPDQLASEKPADQDPHCVPLIMVENTLPIKTVN